MSDTQALQVETITRGAVPEDAMDLAVLKVRSDLRSAHEPALFATVMLAMAEDGLAAMAQATIDLDGRRIRAHAAAESMRAAIELMCDKLRAQLDRAEHGWSRAAERAKLGQHLPQPRPPADDPNLVRHTSYGVPRLAGDEAIADLEMLDYEFHLFTDRAIGEESVMYPTEEGYRLSQVDPPLDQQDLEPLGPTVTMSQVPAPRLGLAEAQARLTALGEPFMFFVNNQTGRGNLVYRRHDGDYGLITPADAET